MEHDEIKKFLEVLEKFEELKSLIVKLELSQKVKATIKLTDSISNKK